MEMQKERNVTQKKGVMEVTVPECLLGKGEETSDFEKFGDVSITEVVGVCTEGEIVEDPGTGDKLEALGIIHPYKGTRFYNRMFPDVPFQYVGKNAKSLGITSATKLSPPNLGQSKVRTASRQGIFSRVIEDRKRVREETSAKTGVANINILKKSRLNKQNETSKELPAFQNVLGGGYEDTLFNANDGPAQLHQPPEYSSITSDSPWDQSMINESSSVEVIELSDEDYAKISKWFEDADSTNNQLK